MLRTALTPRWVALTALMIGFVVAVALLGRWQLGRAESESDRQQAAQRSAAAESRPLRDVTRPTEPLQGNVIGATVSFSGRWEPDEQLLVPGRSVGGREVTWVMTPVVEESTGAVMPVVRGWTEGDEAPPPVSGAVTVVGQLQNSEPPEGDTAVSVPGQVGRISTADLIQRIEEPLYFGLVVAEQLDPASPLPAVPVSPPDGGGGLALRNLGYAVQWWIFGGFALALWWRQLRDEAAVDAAAPSASPPSPSTPSPSTPSPSTPSPSTPSADHTTTGAP